MTQIYNQVRVATNEDINLQLIFAMGVSTIDGVVVNEGDRVLVKSQSSRIQNGLYEFNSIGVLVRTDDFADGSYQTGSSLVFVQEGETFKDTGWVLTTNGAIIVGVTEINFQKFSINETPSGINITSSIILRSEKGYPLTNDELDNNFKYLANELTTKLYISDFNPTSIVSRINTLTYVEAGLNANRLHSYLPSELGETDTIAKRDALGDLTSRVFHGDLDGNAETADLADFATLAGNVTGVVATQHGGTGSSTIDGARENLDVVYRGGDSVYGKLTLDATTEETPISALRITPGTSDPLIYEDGDIWAKGTNIFYRFGDTTKTFAPLESPTFTGSVLAPTPGFASNSGAVATTNFVQQHVTVLNSNINLKANIASPTFTGDAKAVTALLTNETTSISTTKYVADKISNRLGSYYTSTQVDGLLGGLNNTLSESISTTDAKAQEALERSGTPVGGIMHFAATNIPVGWLKCNGAAISKTAYARLFQVIGYTYGGSGEFFKVPDLRGEFLRGFDDGRGIDRGRAMGSWQKGTLTLFDPNYGSHNVTSVIGRYNYSGAVNGLWDDVNDSTGKIGIDYVQSAVGMWPDMLRAEINGAPTPNEIATSGWGYGMSRPRNVAMMPCIKAFGSINDPDSLNAMEVIANVNEKVDKRGDTMTGHLSLVGNPVNPLHATTKSYVDSRISTISLTPGPQGPQGATGAQGPQGRPGIDGTRTRVVSGSMYLSGPWTNGDAGVNVWGTAGLTYRTGYVYLPSGWYFSGGVVSIKSIAYRGVVNSDDVTICTWTYDYANHRVFIAAGNSESDGSSTAVNYLFILS